MSNILTPTTVPSDTNSLMKNPLIRTDGYKPSHPFQYPKGMTYATGYVEPRKGKWDRVLFFGLQAWLKKYMAEPITAQHVKEADEFYAEYGVPFFREGWDHIVKEHKGHLPLHIRALPEGLVVPIGIPLATVINTDPKCGWLSMQVEASMLRAIWYPTTVATLSWHCKQVIGDYLNQTSDDVSQLAFKLHDFGARGTSSHESAALGGMAHLVNFKGSDTIEGIAAARAFYGEHMAGYSIPASEHSTITSWGRSGEEDAYRNMIQQFGQPGKVFAVVSDSYDIYNAVEHIWGERLRDEVKASGATLVVRPDSGDPVKVPVDCIELLGEKFGFTINSKGYRVLDSSVRVIQGDGIGYEHIGLILASLKEKGWAADNIAFGMGGGLLQNLNRDTLGFAMKCSSCCVEGNWVDVYKDPVTDPGKRSKRGQHLVIREDGKYETVPEEGNAWRNLLSTVWSNGDLRRDLTFEEIRKRADSPALD